MFVNSKFFLVMDLQSDPYLVSDEGTWPLLVTSFSKSFQLALNHKLY